ncbi:MAG: apolipoprotein N-acyltransferase, partial [Actinomycetota bacterium]|nr:apolipoprotein N-acyltransferase [Actinomycetota bacterium]
FFYGLAWAAVAALTRHAPTRRWWPLWGAAAWTSAEVVRSGWPVSGMPWGRLAFAVVDTPVAPLLPWVGMVGVSFLLALASACVAHLVLTRARAWRADTAVLLGLVAGASLAGLAPYDAGDPSGTATVAAVQGDVPGPGNDVLFDHRQVTRNHVEETVRLADAVAAGEQPRPDLVVWPENSTAVDPFLDAETNQGIERAVAAIGVPVLVGAIVDDGPEHVLNQGIVWDPATGPGERYTKWHPVPYGEYIPFRQYLDVNFGELARIRRDMRAGDRTEPLEVGPIRLADAICFDVAYDDGLHAQVREGAELLTVQTSNATFIFTDQVDQQFAITRLRAIEAGKWLVVASTNGRSGIIAPDGRVVETVDRRTTATMLAEVELLPGVSPGIHLTPWVTRGVVALTLLGLLLVLIASGAVTRRSRTVAPEYADAGS